MSRAARSEDVSDIASIYLDGVLLECRVAVLKALRRGICSEVRVRIRVRQDGTLKGHVRAAALDGKGSRS